MSELEIKKTYYPNGQIEWEGSFKKGIPHGPNRRWHANGVLASEVYLKEGVPNGIGRQWDKNGNLIVTFEIVNGNGVQRKWDEAQQCFVENTFHKGRMTGKVRSYLKDGTVLSEGYLFQGQTISKKRYMEACKKDPTLPRYDDMEEKKKSPAVKKSPSPDNDDICKGILSSGKVREAREWFKSGRCFLGEGDDEEGSIELVKSLYKAGAAKVWVFDINIDESGEQYSGRLIVEMPKDPEKRKKIFSICDEIAENLGFDPEEDCSQQYRLLMLD
jgi:hypothetical protein